MIENATLLDRIKETFHPFSFLGPKEWIELSSVIQFKQLKKGEHLVRVGEYNYKAVRVIKGLLLHYVIDDQGDEKALLFVPEHMNSGSLLTTLTGQAADENILALEDTLMLCADARRLDQLADQNLRIQKLVNRLHRQIIVEAAERIRFLVVNTPEERYLQFCKRYPNLEQRLKQKDLASYLGVSDTSLSRIKARIAKK